MFTEQSLRDHPPLVKAFTGLESEQFWKVLHQMHELYPSYLRRRCERPERQCEVGGGRGHDLSLVLRTILVLTLGQSHLRYGAR